MVKRQPEPEKRKLTIELEDWLFARVGWMRKQIGAASDEELVFRALRHYDQVVSSGVVEKATIYLHHRNGRKEKMEPI